MSKKTLGYSLPSEDQVRRFELADVMLHSLFQEMKELSKKAPDGRLNSVKVKMINRVVNDMKTTLTDEPATAYLDHLDEDALPSNSDVVLILSQYEAAAKGFKSKHYKRDEFSSTSRWHTRENP